MNPWPDLAYVTPDAILFDKITTYSTNFGIVSALTCALGLSTIGVAWEKPFEKEPSEEKTTKTNKKGEAKKEKAKGHTAVHSHLLQDAGIPRHAWQQIFVGTATTSLYSGLCGLGLSTVSLAWATLTPPGHAAAYVVRHSVMLCGVPLFTSVSVGLLAVAMLVGMDARYGKPISYIALGGLGLTGVVVGLGTASGMVGVRHALRRAAARGGHVPY
jgi:hypothetical protein